MQAINTLENATIEDVEHFIDGNNLGDSPLNLICGTKQPLAVKKALSTTAGEYLVNTPNKIGVTPLIAAIKNDDFGSVYALLENGANPNLADINDDSPLHLAVRFATSNIPRILLKHGAQFTLNSNQENVLHALAENSNPSEIHREWLEAFIGLECDVNAQDIIGDTPLHIASEHGNKEMVEALLAAGADLNIKNNQGLSPDEIPALGEDQETAAKRAIQREIRKKRLFTVV